MHKGGGCIMATNSRNNNNEEVMVDETLSPEVKRMAEKLGISDDGTSDQPTLSSSATEDVVVSTEQKRKPALQRIKEKLQDIKGILKNGTEKNKMALISKFVAAIAGGLIFLTIISTAIASIVKRVEYDANHGNVVQTVAASYSAEQEVIDQANHIINSPFATQAEKDRATTILDAIQKAKETQEEYNTRIAEAESYKVKNVFKANKQMSQIAEDANNLIAFHLYASEINSIYTAVTAREQGAQDQANATNQGTVQSIINGEGTYYNMDKIQDTKNQIDGYFADANGNGTPDIVDAVNGIEDDKLKNLANKALASMNEAKASADITFETLQVNWNIFMEHVNSGSYPTALSYYNVDIAPAASELNTNLGSVQTGYDQIQNYVQNDQQQSIVTGAFSKKEIEDNAKIFENMGISGTINSIDYTYDIQTGKINMNVNSENGSQIQSTVIQFKTKAGFNSIDVGSVMSVLRNSNSVNMNIYNISNTSQYGTLTVSENGKTSTISSQFSIGYSSSVSYKNGVTMLNVKVVVQDAEGNIYNIGSTKNSYQGKLSTSEIQSLIQEISSNCVKSSGIQFLDQADIELL